jgi:hypothetical protein
MLFSHFIVEQSKGRAFAFPRRVASGVSIGFAPS